jgi:hypothetical protein
MAGQDLSRNRGSKRKHLREFPATNRQSRPRLPWLLRRDVVLFNGGLDDDDLLVFLIRAIVLLDAYNVALQSEARVRTETLEDERGGTREQAHGVHQPTHSLHDTVEGIGQPADKKLCQEGQGQTRVRQSPLALDLIALTCCISVG